MAIDFDKYKNRRIELGLSQQEVADALGISLRAYHYYEKKEREPRPGMIKLLDELLFSDNMQNVRKIADQENEDKEKELLYEIKELQNKQLKEKEGGTFNFPLAAMDMLTMIEAYAQVTAQYTAQLVPENKGKTGDQIEEKLRADVNKVYLGLKKAMGKGPI